MSSSNGGVMAKLDANQQNTLVSNALMATLAAGLVYAGLWLSARYSPLMVVPLLAATSVLFLAPWHMRPKTFKVDDLTMQKLEWGEASMDEIHDTRKFYRQVGQVLSVIAGAGLVYTTYRSPLGGWEVTAAIALAAIAGFYKLPVLPTLFAPIIRKLLLKQAGAKDEQSFGSLMFRRVEAMFKDHQNPKLSGDLEAVAKAAWPVKDHPEMHVEMPVDVVRPLVWDGRLFTGDDVSILAPRKVSLNAIRMSYTAAFKRVVFGLSHSTSIAALVLVTAIVSSGVAIKGGASEGRNAYQSSGAAYAGPADDMRIALTQQDVFSAEEATKVANTYRDANKPSSGWFYKVVGWLASAAAFVAYAPLIALAMLAGLAAVGLRIALAGRNPASMMDAVINSDIALLMDTKDSIVQRKFRQEVHLRELKSWRNQIAASNRDTFPLVQVGQGTGTMLYRGLLSGYMPHQPVMLSLDDITRGGVVIFGATGSGKSYSLGKPIMNGVFNSAKLDYSLSMFVMDGKAVLWRDAAELAKAAGWRVRIIGCGPGEFGVDLFDGIDPHIVASALNEVMVQLSGSGNSDPFWTDMASQIIAAAARITFVAELTDFGLKYAVETGERLYSPVGVYNTCFSVGSADKPAPKDGLLARCIDAILTQAEGTDDDVAVVAPYLTADLWADIDFLRTTVPNTFSDTTVGGFMTNISRVLKGFVSMNDVRERFGSARGDIIDVDRIWDDRTVTALRMSDFQYGDYARIVAVLLKIRVYHRAAVRMEQDPQIADKSKLVLVLDEFQRLVSANGAYSEPSVLSISRAMGLGFVCMLQTVAGLRMALGNDRTENLMGQFRTKIFLSAEDNATSSYLQQLAGTTKRSMTFGANSYESWWAHRLETTGQMTDVIDADELSEADVMMLTDVSPKGQPKKVMARKIDYGFGNSSRETTASAEGLASNFVKRTVDAAQHMMGMTNEGVSRARAELSQGNEDRALVSVNDINSLGQGQAVVIINREASPRMDIIELMPELGFVRPAASVQTEGAKAVAASDATQRVEQRRLAAAAVTAAKPELAKA